MESTQITYNVDDLQEKNKIASESHHIRNLMKYSEINLIRNLFSEGK